MALKLYPDSGPGLALRVALDAALVLWLLAWAAAGLAVHAAVEDLQAVSDGIGGAGADFNQLISAFTGAIPRGIPGISAFLSAQAEALKRVSGDQLITSAHHLHDGIDRLALILALVVALPPILIALAAHLQWRIRDAREMGAARQFVTAARRAGRMRLAEAALAFRALSTLSFTELMRASDDPVGDLAAHRYDRLSAAMMRRAGLSPPRRPAEGQEAGLALPAARDMGDHGDEEHDQG